MTRIVSRRLQAALPAGTLILAALLAAAGPADAQTVHRSRRRAAPDTTASRAALPGTAAADTVVPPSGIRDPLLELLVGFAEGDSLGSWDGAAIARYVAASGRPSRLPVAEIARVTRRVAQPAESEERRGARATRIWEIEMTRPQRLPLPYSFLGYHPGTLASSPAFRLSEWRLGAQNLHVARDGRVGVYPVTGMLVLRVDDGWFVLDVDAWLDKLLGGLLDDYWTDGFALARWRGAPVEVSLLAKRDGKPDYGQFDLGHDRIIAHPEAVARGLGLLARPWVAPPPGSSRRPWAGDSAQAVTP